jgi:hypothetical protein
MHDKPHPSTASHSHSHSHGHSHSHARTSLSGTPALVPDFSLLRLSMPQRVALALLPTAVMWALLLWAFAE